MRQSSLVRRFGQVDLHSTLLRASIIAAHAVSTATGFRASDVRFFFRLFGNWLEIDVLHPSQDIQLVQIGRVLRNLEEDKHLTRTTKRSVRYREQRVRLRGSGLLLLADKLVEECVPSFHETLFVLHFAASYRDILRARVLASGENLPPVTRRRLSNVLDPKRIAKRAIRDCELLVADLEQRLKLDRDLETELGRLRTITSDDTIACVLTNIGAYQLERVQPLRQLMRMLPEDLRRAELTRGVSGRRHMLFEPLLARCRTELALLRGLAESLSRPS